MSTSIPSMAKLASILSLSLAPNGFAFQPSSSAVTDRATSRRGFALREQPDNLASLSGSTSTTSDWIKDEFEQVQLPAQDEVKAGSFSSSQGLLNQGRIVGPDRVLLYDTTLRGENLVKHLRVRLS